MLQTNVSFLVDTGADQCVLMPADGVRSGIDYTKLTGDEAIGGAGGTTKMFVEPAFAVFWEPGVGLRLYRISMLIAPISPDLAQTPSLLGRSVLDRWKMTYDPSAKSLVFDVVSADQTIPVPSAPKA
jgi:predicted aspartyl protease